MLDYNGYHDTWWTLALSLKSTEMTRIAQAIAVNPPVNVSTYKASLCEILENDQRAITVGTENWPSCKRMYYD